MLRLFRLGCHYNFDRSSTKWFLIDYNGVMLSACGLTGFLRKKRDRAPTRGISPSNGSITTLNTPWIYGNTEGHTSTYMDVHTQKRERSRELTPLWPLTFFGGGAVAHDRLETRSQPDFAPAPCHPPPYP